MAEIQAEEKKVFIDTKGWQEYTQKDYCTPGKTLTPDIAKLQIYLFWNKYKYFIKKLFLIDFTQ